MEELVFGKIVLNNNVFYIVLFSKYELKREPEVTVKETVSQQEPIEEAVPHVKLNISLTERIKQGKDAKDKKSDKALSILCH